LSIFWQLTSFCHKYTKTLVKKGVGWAENAISHFPCVASSPICHFRRINPSRAHDPTKERKMLNNIGLPGLLLIAVVVLVLFGRGKISSLMGEVGKGITAFKKGVDDGKQEIEDGLAEAKDVTPEEEKDKV
jgi:sec-independent protein translocase protein TatA